MPWWDPRKWIPCWRKWQQKKPKKFKQPLSNFKPWNGQYFKQLWGLWPYRSCLYIKNVQQRNFHLVSHCVRKMYRDILKQRIFTYLVIIIYMFSFKVYGHWLYWVSRKLISVIQIGYKKFRWWISKYIWKLWTELLMLIWQFY